MAKGQSDLYSADKNLLFSLPLLSTYYEYIPAECSMYSSIFFNLHNILQSTYYLQFSYDKQKT